MSSIDASAHRLEKIRELFDQYIKLYAARDERLIAFLSESFSGYAVGGRVLIKSRDEWIRIIRQDYAEIPEPLRIETDDMSMQRVSDDVVLVTALFRVRLPIAEPPLWQDSCHPLISTR